MKKLLIYTFFIISQTLFTCLNGISIRKFKKLHQSSELNDEYSRSPNMILDLSAESPASPSAKFYRIQEYSAIQKFLLEKKPLGKL